MLLKTATYCLVLIFLVTSINKVNCQFNLSKVDKAEHYGFSIDSLNAMNNHFHNLIDNKQIAGIQTAIIKDGKLCHFDNYGFADIENNILLNNKSIFRIFSMTKPIVSVALMQLNEQDKFRLDDPLSLYIPAFKEMYIMKEDGEKAIAKKEITIRDLLRHTSGIGYGRGDNEQLNNLYHEANLHTKATNKEFVEVLANLPLYSEPGQTWHYSYSTNVCGYLVEVLSNMELDEYLNINILKPLLMDNTSFQVPASKFDNFTVGYRWDEETGLAISEPLHPNRYTQEVTLFNGGGGMVSTTSDYLNFCQMFLNKGQFNGKRILKEETVDIMTTDQLVDLRKLQDPPSGPSGETGFGLGFAINAYETEGTKGIYGWGGAVGTYFRIDPKLNMAYIMMIQLSPYQHLGLRNIFQDYVFSALK
jgi:CubicO group peptidase (beta-lactamase class C family)